MAWRRVVHDEIGAGVCASRHSRATPNDRCLLPSKWKAVFQLDGRALSRPTKRDDTGVVPPV
jgi:hypothetical protein